MANPPKDNDKEKDFQETVAFSREELEIPAEKEEAEEKDYQETVALSREGLGISSGSESPGSGKAADDTYQETVALSREEMSKKASDDDYQETIALSREEIRGNDPDEGYQETVALTKESMGVRVRDQRSQRDENDFSASEMEKTFFIERVLKDREEEKYHYHGKIVSGGMGAILKVLDQNLQRTIAMKVILPHLKDDIDTLNSFITESRITGLLEHPNIIPVHELDFNPESGIFFTMKLVHGESLIDLLKNIKSGNIEYQERYSSYHLLNIFRKVCDAISFAHSRSIIHQDIKPHNIIVGPYGEVLLMDWGLARYIGDPEAETDSATRTLVTDVLETETDRGDLIKGSPAYMSPEQVTGEPLDRQSDIFLMGATLYHIFTLEPPYVAKEMQQILSMAMNGRLIPPEERRPDRQIPEEICRIIKKAMSPAREDRYASVDEMAGDIDDLIAGRWTRQEKRHFSAGEFLMKEGESGEEAYLILNGRVEVVKAAHEKQVVLGELGPGDTVGEMSLIASVTRSASVKAAEETEAAILTKDLVSQNLKKLPPYMEKIVSALTDRLRIANANIHPYAIADPTDVVLKQLRLLFREKSDNQMEGFSAPIDAIISEIAQDLGLAQERVREVFDRADEIGVIKIRADLVSIPDISLLGK